MRALLLFIMIALLPLRGWAGEVMATEMASSQVAQAHIQTQSATESGAARAYIHWVSGNFEGKNQGFEAGKQLFEVKHAQTLSMPDCEGHPKTGEAAAVNAHCDTCPACQACHTVALSTKAVSLNIIFYPRILPRLAVTSFVSAITALGQKPPIS